MSTTNKNLQHNASMHVTWIHAQSYRCLWESYLFKGNKLQSQCWCVYFLMFYYFFGHRSVYFNSIQQLSAAHKPERWHNLIKSVNPNQPMPCQLEWWIILFLTTCGMLNYLASLPILNSPLPSPLFPPPLTFSNHSPLWHVDHLYAFPPCPYILARSFPFRVRLGHIRALCNKLITIILKKIFIHWACKNYWTFSLSKIKSLKFFI